MTFVCGAMLWTRGAKCVGNVFVHRLLDAAWAGATRVSRNGSCRALHRSKPTCGERDGRHILLVLVGLDGCFRLFDLAVW